ncbi:MAG: hypothetical protein H6582_02980 [Crocinitomicaceae bacterium]|nr:hypothetical protein [Crocinitomicaceae bacterium]
MFVENQNTNPPPRPIPKRECKCGCGHNFQPNRKDQVYLNKQHADFGYNHGQRKTKQANRLKVEKILRKNDLILKKFFALSKDPTVTIMLENLKADGFRSEYNIGREKDKSGNLFFFLYNYAFRIVIRDNKKLIIIKKL